METAIADKFRLDVLKDAEGNTFSSAEKMVLFKDKNGKAKEAEENIILTAEEAATYTLDAVFGDWKPANLSAQAAATAATLDSDKLSWTGDAQMYLVAKDGKFFALTTEKSVNLNGEKGTFTVRAANQMGGFGATTNSVSTGIRNIASATDAAVIKTAIYAADGTQLSNLQKGINIIVKTQADGSKKTSKVIVK